MQVNTHEESCLDDLATEGDIQGSDDEEMENNDDEILNNEDAESRKENEEFHGDAYERVEKKGNLIENSDDSEKKDSEEDDRVVDLEMISQGLILGLNDGAPDEVIQKTSYLNTHVSTYSEDNDRRITVQHIDGNSLKED